MFECVYDVRARRRIFNKILLTLLADQNLFYICNDDIIGIKIVFRTSGPSDWWTFGLAGLRTSGPSDRWAFGLKGLRTIGRSPHLPG